MFTEITGQIYIRCQVEPKEKKYRLLTLEYISRQVCYKLQRKQFGLDVGCLGLFKVFQVVKFSQCKGTH